MAFLVAKALRNQFLKLKYLVVKHLVYVASLLSEKQTRTFGMNIGHSP